MSSTCRWKPPIFTHNSSLPPSTSFVLAEPQQTRSLPSAVDKLPNILRRAMPPDQDPSQSNTDSTSVDAPMSTADRSSESPLNAAGGSDQSVPVHPSPSLATPPVQGHVSDTPSADPSPAVVSHDSIPQPSLARERSWLNLFYWSTHKETSVREVSNEEASRTPDVVHTCTEPSDNNCQHVALETNLPAESTAVNCNGHPHLHSPGSDTVSRTAPASNATDASSRRDVPSTSPSLSNASQQSPPLQARGGVTLPVADNPATSMFGLGFSLPAEPRRPPEVTVTLPLHGPSPTGVCDNRPVATPDPGNSQNAASVNATESHHMTSATDVSECGDQPLGQPTTVTEVRAETTWWMYLGWAASPSAAEANSKTQSADACTSLADTEQPPTSDPSEGSLLCSSSAVPAPTQPADEMEARVDASVVERLPSDDQKLHAAQDANTAKVSRGHAWYTPWSRYQSSSSATTTTIDMNPGSQQDPLDQTQSGPQTDEKDATDREAQSSSAQASIPLQDPSARPVVYNDVVQSVMSTNPTGWMSFITAKAAIAMKSITYEKEGGKMEVMEIDEEITPELNSVSSSPSTATQASPTSTTKSPTRAQSHPAEIPPRSSPPPRKSTDKQPAVPHAVIKTETVANDILKRQPSPAPSKKSGVKTPTLPPPPNLVLPTWNDTFHALPRSKLPQEPPSVLSKTLQYVSGVLFSTDEPSVGKGKGKAKETVRSPHDKALPRTWDALGKEDTVDVLRGCKRVVIIGVHGWFPGAVLRTLAGEPTGTSSKFVNGIVDALDVFLEEHKAKLDKVTKIPLEGEGTINRRVERLYQNLIGNKEWMDDLHDADAIFVATHSQGSIVSTHLLDRLIADRHIRTGLNTDASVPASGVASGSVSAVRPPQRICCLGLCGIHLGPLRYLGTSSLVQPYIQYFESTAARELFEFQNTESALSRDYVRALGNVLNNGIKMVYIASLNDQVVGLYSGLFTSVSHPLILRALYIDGDAYHPSDFLSNLLVLLLRIRNAGLSDGGLLAHLSEVTAGSLNGIGHSTPYEERATYSLAINYLFLTDSGSGSKVELAVESFNALAERNDYEIPWALRDLIADERVLGLFSDDIVALRDAFRDWHPKTSILRDVKRKLQPIQRLSSALMTSHTSRL